MQKQCPSIFSEFFKLKSGLIGISTSIYDGGRGMNLKESYCHRNVLGGRAEVGVENATEVSEVSTLVP
jgi:hypothetical protein